jgi:hypothetical protein
MTEPRDVTIKRRNRRIGFVGVLIGVLLIGFAGGLWLGRSGDDARSCRDALRFISSTGAYVPGDPANDVYRQNVATCLGTDVQ